jgi:BirA family biotin operon repressor/biotin-[acetyl-CoA-carboxylase] ligase
VPVLIGHAVTTAIRNLTGLVAETKWPNDVLIDEKKICGILCEVRGNGIIAGVGINVNISEYELPVPTATSLSIKCGNTINRDDVLISVSSEIHSHFNKWNKSEIDIEELVIHSATIGRKVRIEYVNGEVAEGVVSEISRDGSLVLESGERFNVGDVTHLR